MYSCCHNDGCGRKLRLCAQMEALKQKVKKNVECPNELFGEEAFSNFQIIAGNGKKTFYVTKYQMALRSKVFEKMFLSNMKEATAGVLNLEDDPDVVEAMLKYIYMNIPVKGNKLARKVIALAHRYEMEDLRDQCELEIIETLTVKDAQDSLMMALELELPLLFTKCNEYLYHNFNDFGECGLTVEPKEFLFDNFSHLTSSNKVKNHTNTSIAYKFYSYEPFTSRSPFRILEASKQETLLTGAVTYAHSQLRSSGVVYYAPYINDKSIDYNQLHLLPNARFITVTFVRRF